MTIASDEPVTLEISNSVSPGDRLGVTVGAGDSVEISVESCRELGCGKYLVTGHPTTAALTGMATPTTLGQRRHSRSKQRLRVMSADLPDYRALTVDCSPSGLQLEMAEPLLVGDVLGIKLGLPNSGPDVECQVEVVWCQPCQNVFRAGCSFVESPPTLREALALLEPSPAILGRGRHRRNLSGFELTPPPPSFEEQAPLEAELKGYAVEGDTAMLRLHLEDGEVREISFSPIKFLRDLRGHHGQRTGFLSCMQLPEGGSLIRFLGPEHEKLLEIVTCQRS